MEDRVAVVIFARIPYMGSVKTRLAKGIGVGAATKLYRAMTAHTIKEVQGGARFFIAQTPDKTHDDIFPASLKQGGGDLGQRLERIAKKYAPVIFLSTDSPNFTRKVLAAAIKGLKTHDIVVAPAQDGGYGLIGLRNGALPLFRKVRWSSPHTLADTLANAPHKRALFLPPLLDIDEVEDLLQARQELGKGARLIPAI